MTQSAVFLLLCGALSLIGLKRPLVPLSIGMALYVFVPVAASQAVVGVTLGQVALVHPGSYLFAVYLATLALLDAKRLVRALGSAPALTVGIVIFLVVAFVTTYFEVGFGGLGVLINQIAGPFAAFIVIKAAPFETAVKLAKLFVVAVALQAVVAVVVYAGLLLQPYDAALRSAYGWYALGLGGTRAVGTTDHPLVLGMFLVVAIPLVTLFRRASTQILLSGLFITGIVLSQSRTSLALSAVALAFLIFKSKLPARVRAGVAVGALATAVILGASSLSSGIADRLEDDGGSAGGRADAWVNGLPLWPSHLILGDGSGASIQAAVAAGLGTSFESPLLMYAIDYGVLASLLLFVSMVSVLVRRRGASRIDGASVAGLLAVISIQTFSSIATLNSIGGVLFIVLAISSHARTSEPEDMPIGAADTRLHNLQRDEAVMSPRSALTR